MYKSGLNPTRTTGALSLNLSFRFKNINHEKNLTFSNSITIYIN